MKKILCLILAILLMSITFLSGCSSSLTAVKSEDKYRNYYQIFINSFCDSNDDQTGDFQGIISKLDYLNDGDPNNGDDLGIDGIWLSPMMPSPSYHKYDVTDYQNIDEEYGTLDDFDQFISECNERGIKVIIDYVVNHSSSRHPFFQKACEELQQGKTDGYARYYNFSKGMTPECTQHVNNTQYYYEGRFSPEMPDWNLDYEGTKEYLLESAKFWLDRGVAGFRLDAVKYFYLGDNDKSCEFLKWFYDSCKEYKEDVYMVGEDWDDAGYVYDMYKSGIDSLFNFKFGNTDGVYVSSARSGQMKNYTTQLKKYNDNILKRNEKAINANFLTNHDMVRVANTLDVDENKFAAMLYILSPGNSFTYYGEEIGIEAPNTSNDASYRTAMIWDNDNLPDIYVNGVAEVEENPLGGVKQQLEDKDSLLNTYRELYKIKLQIPELARGKITDVINSNEIRVSGYVEEYEGTKLVIAYNGESEEKEFDISQAGNSFGLLTSVCISNELKASLSGTKVKLPSMSVAILKVK